MLYSIRTNDKQILVDALVSLLERISGLKFGEVFSKRDLGALRKHFSVKKFRGLFFEALAIYGAYSGFTSTIALSGLAAGQDKASIERKEISSDIDEVKSMIEQSQEDHRRQWEKFLGQKESPDDDTQAGVEKFNPRSCRK